MYALIAAREEGGEPVLLATARTLPAIQRKFDVALNTKRSWFGMLLLTPKGVVNYHGNKVPMSSIGRVSVKMGLDYD